MQHRTVLEIMTHDVVTVGPTASFKEIARLFCDHDISAVPVVDDSRRLLGVVAADLMSAPAITAQPTWNLIAVDGVVALHKAIDYTYDNRALDVEPPR
ncbi:CBS domain-containing protein [Streptomyces clavifer]|uniref:CBS domain-containing protein n=1 Tax=Streptomyces clavifer TaxID=68188 RepID=UPI0036654B62